MVSEAMLLMGAVVAEFGREDGLALPFRSQPPADLPSPEELQADSQKDRPVMLQSNVVSAEACRAPAQCPTSALVCRPTCRPPHRSVVMRICWPTDS